MSGQYDNTNTFILGRNERKETEKHPDFAGNLTQIECPSCGEKHDYWLNGWVKERKDGSGKFFSGSVRAKDQKTQKKSPPKTHKEIVADLDDDIPF